MISEVFSSLVDSVFLYFKLRKKKKKLCFTILYACKEEYFLLEMESKSLYLLHTKFCPVSSALWDLFILFSVSMKGSKSKYIYPTKDYFLEFIQIRNWYLFSRNNVFQQELHAFAIRKKTPN